MYEPQAPIISYIPFKKLGIDVIGPLPTSRIGKEDIVMGVDYMTRWVEAVETRHFTTTVVAKFIFENIC